MDADGLECRHCILTLICRFVAFVFCLSRLAWPDSTRVKSGCISSALINDTWCHQQKSRINNFNCSCTLVHDGWPVLRLLMTLPSAARLMTFTFNRLKSCRGISELGWLSGTTLDLLCRSAFFVVAGEASSETPSAWRICCWISPNNGNQHIDNGNQHGDLSCVESKLSCADHQPCRVLHRTFSETLLSLTPMHYRQERSHATLFLLGFVFGCGIGC